MRMGQGVRTGLGHGGITCVLQTFSSYLFSTLFHHKYNYDGPNGSLFISILLHNSEFRTLNSEFRFYTANFGIRNCEVYVIWASGNC